MERNSKIERHGIVRKFPQSIYIFATETRKRKHRINETLERPRSSVKSGREVKKGERREKKDRS